MGEVFRARDARLKRDVALKVLPALTIEAQATEIRLVVNFLDELRARVK